MARATEELDKSEGKIRSEGNKGGDAQKVGEAAAAGASIGAISGSIAGHAGMGVGIGAAAGATAALVGVCLARARCVLAKGTTLGDGAGSSLVYEETEVQLDATRA